MALLGSSSSANPVVSQALSGSDIALADAGYQYVALETTPGVTGIIGPVSTTLDETKALMRIFNNGGPSSGAVSISLRWLRLHVFTIGTGGTRVHFTQAIDSGPDRYSSQGSSLTVNNTNMGGANTTAVDVKFGALTLGAASSNRRFVGNTSYKATTIETVEDCYQFSWGSADQLQDPASLSTTAAATSNISYGFPPITLQPGQSWILHQWRASISVGITFGVEMSLVVK